MTEKRTVATIEVLDAIEKLKSEVDQVKKDMLAQHIEKMEELEEINRKVAFTNGKVAMLVEDKIAREAVERYKAERGQFNQPIAAVKVDTAWDWKVVLTIIMTLATVAAGILGVTSK